MMTKLRKVNVLSIFGDDGQILDQLLRLTEWTDSEAEAFVQVYEARQKQKPDINRVLVYSLYVTEERFKQLLDGSNEFIYPN